MCLCKWVCAWKKKETKHVFKKQKNLVASWARLSTRSKKIKKKKKTQQDKIS